MGKKSKKAATSSNNIAVNKKARFEYQLEDKLEAGIALEGWEVKSLRAGRVQFNESYVLLKNGEAFLFGTLITPLESASTHIHPDPMRTRKLLLHRYELNKLIGAVDRKGYTIVPLSMFWQKGKIKVSIAYAKGKKAHDKRATEKARDWQREKQRLLKAH